VYLLVMPHHPGMTVGQALKAAREARGISQGTLARESGISSAQISRLETGDREDAKLATVAALARALGVSIDGLSRGEVVAFDRPVPPEVSAFPGPPADAITERLAALEALHGEDLQFEIEPGVFRRLGTTRGALAETLSDLGLREPGFQFQLFPAVDELRSQHDGLRADLAAANERLDLALGRIAELEAARRRRGKRGGPS
jgi:transcriptional regulator with XRE-family HTH domain